MHPLNRVSKLLAKLICLSLLSFVAIGASAQGVIQPARTGVFELIEHFEEYIIISGVQFGIDLEEVEVVLRGEPLDYTYLEEGMVVRYTLRNGMIIRMEVLGPNNLIENIDLH